MMTASSMNARSCSDCSSRATMVLFILTALGSRISEGKPEEAIWMRQSARRTLDRVQIRLLHAYSSRELSSYGDWNGE